jgi:hypothetical protein
VARALVYHQTGPNSEHFFAHPSPDRHRHPIPVFRENCVFLKCAWKCPQDGERGSRVVKNHYRSAPPMPEPPPPLTTRVLFLSDSVEGRRIFPHVTTHLRVKCRLEGRDVVPEGVWPTLMLRGVSQPTPNAPEVPRAIGVCLNIASGHVRRYFDVSEVLDAQFPPIFAM